MDSVCPRDLLMRLLIAFIALAGVSAGALGYFASNGKGQSGKRKIFIGLNDSSATLQNKTGSYCEDKCCDEDELENQDPT